MSEAIYDTIGVGYSNLRRPDPRIQAYIDNALGEARRVLNVGAGAGSYEPADRDVTAVEPSAEMIAQRPKDSAPVVQSSAENLPFDDNSFDAVMGVLTIHHWDDQIAGLREMQRVAKNRIVLLTYDPASRPWLTQYLPELAQLDEEIMPPVSLYEMVLGQVEIAPLLIPHDCTDGFLHAFWRRPQAYLDPKIRAGSSSFWKLKDLDAGLDQLRRDLESGQWETSHADICALDAYDAGYRLVIAEVN